MAYLIDTEVDEVGDTGEFGRFKIGKVFKKIVSAPMAVIKPIVQITTAPLRLGTGLLKMGAGYITSPARKLAERQKIMKMKAAQKKQIKALKLQSKFAVQSRSAEQEANRAMTAQDRADELQSMADQGTASQAQADQAAEAALIAEERAAFYESNKMTPVDEDEMPGDMNPSIEPEFTSDGTIPQTYEPEREEPMYQDGSTEEDDEFEGMGRHPRRNLRGSRRNRNRENGRGFMDRFQLTPQPVAGAVPLATSHTTIRIKHPETGRTERLGPKHLKSLSGYSDEFEGMGASKAVMWRKYALIAGAVIGGGMLVGPPLLAYLNKGGAAKVPVTGPTGTPQGDVSIANGVIQSAPAIVQSVLSARGVLPNQATPDQALAAIEAVKRGETGSLLGNLFGGGLTTYLVIGGLATGAYFLLGKRR